MIRGVDHVQRNAKKVKYPYKLVLAEKDAIVNNRLTREWHGKTSSKIKSMRLMPGAFHELAKDQKSDILFEECLKFMGERLTGTDGG